MRATQFTPTAEAAGLDFRSEIRIVIAYDDVADGKRAMQTYHNLAGELERGSEFNYELWKFDALQVPQLSELAAQQARGADIIIVATHNCGLPSSVKSWIASWLRPGAGRPRALVALLVASVKELNSLASVSAYLRDVALSGGMEFFQNVEEPSPTKETAEFYIERIRKRADTATVLLEEILHQAQPEPRWGINE